MKFKLLLFILLYSALLTAQNTNKSVGFIENKGQIIDQKGRANGAVKFLLNTNGLNVQLRKNGFSYDIYETKKHPLTKKQIAERQPLSDLRNEKNKSPDYSLEFIYHRIDIDFANSNPNVAFIAEEKSGDYDNYYNVAYAPEGITNVYRYKQVTYKNIYPNIDVVFSIPEDSSKTVEYNFIIRPKGKISDIQMKFNGAKTNLVDNKIKMNVRFGEMEETLPLSWTEDNYEKKEIAVGYKKIGKNTYGFESAEIFFGKTVIIDPVPSRLWASYYGGDETDYIAEANTDSLGNLIITGNTFSRNNLTTTGAFIVNHYSTDPSSFEPDGYIIKTDSNGVKLWATYLKAIATDVDLDSDNNVISTGYAYYFDVIGTPGTHKPTKILNDFDGYILKLYPSGVRIWGTFYGGNGVGQDIIYSSVIDNANNIIVTGGTYSDTNITTPGTFKTTKTIGYKDAFVAKINPNGQRIWGTYYGGDIDEDALGITIDENNNTYIVGNTQSNNGIANGNAHQNTLSYDYSTGFIAGFNSTGNIIFGTYLGGSNYNYFNKIDYHNQKILVSGTTTSINISTTSNAPYPNPSSSILSISNGFFASFSINGTIIMGSYFQNAISDSGYNNFGNIFITGISSDPGIGTLNSYQPNLFNWSTDTFIVKFDTNYLKEWGTYYGGDSIEDEAILHIDKLTNFIYVGSRTHSVNNISSSNGFQPIKDEWEDVFIAKLFDCQSAITTIASNTPTCVGDTIELSATGGTSYIWIGPNGFTSDLQSPTISNASAANSGTYSCTITGTTGCDVINSVTVLVGDAIQPTPNVTPLPNVTGDCTTVISTIPSAIDNCSGSVIATTSSPTSYNLPGTYTIVWNYDDGNGNISTQNQTVIITPQPLPSTTSPQTFCIDQNTTLNNITITGQNIQWYDALTGGNLLPTTTVLQNNVTYYASQTLNGCESLRTPIAINIQNTPSPTGNANQTLCSSVNPTLTDIVVTGTDIIWYVSLIGGVVLPANTPVQTNTTYYCTQTVNGCESTTRLAVNVTLINTLNANNYTESFCDDLNDGSEILDLESFNTNLITDASNCTFEYYTTLNGAKNQISADQINTVSNYSLTTGNTVIYVRINSNNGCHQVVELNFTLFSKPVIPIADIVPNCENKTINVNAGNGFDTYLWSTGAITSSILINQAGNYNVTVTQNHGAIICSSTKNFTVVLSNIATITEINSQDWTDNENVIVVNTSGVGDYEYSIDGVHFQNSNTFTDLASGNYEVTVRDKNGCGSTTEEVFLLMYPKFFTPNGDGYNDNWNIKFSNLELGLEVKIFDRYGKFIKQLQYNEAGWDGTYNNKNLPSTDYWFVVTRANGKEFRGHFAMKR